MKILFVLHLPPPVHGSAAVGLQIKSSTVVNDAFDCKYINLGTSKTIEEIGKRSIIKIFRYGAIFLKVLWNIVFNRPDLCYFSLSSQFTPFYKDALLVILVKLLGIKTVYHFHNKGVILRQDNSIDNLLYKLVFRDSSVILLSKNLYPDIQKYVQEEQVYYCPNGIPNVEINLDRKGKKDLVELLFLSNLMESKGVFILLEVCKIFKGKKLPFHCTFVGGIGDISERQFNAELEKLDLKDCVDYVGKKFGKEKEQAFANADIFIHPTLNDCFPLVLLEAMQYSLPVVSTFEGGITDIVEDDITGYLVQKNDVQALAERIETLIMNPSIRERFGKNGRLKFEHDFTLDIFEHKLKNILHNMPNN